MAAVDVKQLIQELVVPELRERKAEVKVFQSEIKRLEEKIDLQGARLDEKIDAQGARLDEKIAKLDGKIDGQIARLNDKIDTQGARLDDKIVSRRHEMLSEFRRLGEKIDLTLDIRERLVSLEARMASYATRN